VKLENTSCDIEDEEQSAFRLPVLKKLLLHRLVADRLASFLVSLSGIFVVLTICAIVFVITAEIIPLFMPPRVTMAESLAVGGENKAKPSSIVAVGVDDYQEVVYIIRAEGLIEFFSLESGEPLESVRIPGTDLLAHPVHVLGSGPEYFIVLDDGSIFSAVISFTLDYSGGSRAIVPQVDFGQPAKFPDAAGVRPSIAAAGKTENGAVYALPVGDNEIFLLRRMEKKSLLGTPKVTVVERRIELALKSPVTKLLLNRTGDLLFAGSAAGELAVINILSEDPQSAITRTNIGDQSVTLLGLLLADQTLIVGNAAGEIRSFFVKRDYTTGGALLIAHHAFREHRAVPKYFARSERNRSFITADESGLVHLHYGTSCETLLSFSAPSGLAALSLAAKADGILALSGDGRLVRWNLENYHPEATLHTLFGKVWYEGRDRPEYVWQSTGATDEFESKLSLVPLIFGTLKGTCYALLFAVPVAVLGALYVSQFMDPALRSYIKPAVELMAALPSVVIGFLAGLWLAPRVENGILGLFLFPLWFCAAVLIALLFWKWLPRKIVRFLPPGSELAFLMLTVAAGVWFSLYSGVLLEEAVFSGDFLGFLREQAGAIYDQRNSIVVGLAMGFAVIPLIFTITEDCLSAVPRNLVAASLALGATKWQTAARVVLPSASPGIFSAVMIGFGRAVGETMIVLMATGNTPILDWSVFNGFRAMSANIAVELPEAPHGGTLYRVLFLTALLLFVLTFVINMISEVVRQRLRKRYQAA